MTLSLQSSYVGINVYMDFRGEVDRKRVKIPLNDENNEQIRNEFCKPGDYCAPDDDSRA